MEHVSELLDAYAGMNAWARALIRDVAADYAKRWPAPKRQAVLTLLPSPISIKPAPDLLDNTVDRRPTIIIRKAIN